MVRTVFLSLCLCVAALTSCTTDAYDKGEGKFSMMTAEMVDAHVGADKKVDFAVTDDGERLVPQKPFTISWITKGDTTYRALFYFNRTKNAQHQVEAVGMNRVGTLIPVVTDSLEDGVKTDPLYIESTWVGKSLRYLNLRIRLLTGVADDEEARHTLGLVADSLSENADGTRTIFLRLYHDQGGRPEYYSVTTYASIPLDSIRADSLRLTVNTYQGIMTKTVAVSPTPSASPPTHLPRRGE